ncbi:MAG: hypothetical protein ACW99G_22405 [Candidatus Thorarchaeota archaeon]|jgi:predicted membrane channel-forming protein YqfA (hemolysin III family)
MNRKDIVKNLVIIFGFILLVLTIIELLIRSLSITLDPVLLYWSQTFFLVSIFVFLILSVIFIEVRNR